MGAIVAPMGRSYVDVRFWLVRRREARILAACLVRKYTNELDCPGTPGSTASSLLVFEQPVSIVVPSARRLHLNVKTSPFIRVPRPLAKRVIGLACDVARSVRRERRLGAVHRPRFDAGCDLSPRAPSMTARSNSSRIASVSRVATCGVCLRNTSVLRRFRLPTRNGCISQNA